MKYIKPVGSLSVNTHTCIACGMCVHVCPHNVFSIENKKAQINDNDACMECGACKMNCPVGAIDVRSGVGCAYAVINGLIKGTAPDCSCDCGGDDPGCC